MEQFRENLMKNLLIELQGSKTEMEEKLNHVMIQNIKLTTGHLLTFVPSWKKPRIHNSLKKKRKNSVPKTPLYMVMKSHLVTTRMML